MSVNGVKFKTIAYKTLKSFLYLMIIIYLCAVYMYVYIQRAPIFL